MKKTMKLTILTIITIVGLAIAPITRPMDFAKGVAIPTIFATAMMGSKYGLNKLSKCINHRAGQANAMPIFNDSFGHNACNFVAHLLVGSMLYKAFFSK